MKKIIKLLILVSMSSFLLTNCQNEHSSYKKQFKIELQHFAAAAGFSLKYVVDNHQIKIHHNCDFANCKDKIIYDVKLDPTRAKGIHNFIQTSRFDTLQDQYETPDILDGNMSQIKVSGEDLPSKNIFLKNFKHPLIEALIDSIDLAIPDIEHRHYKYKYKDPYR